MKAIDTNVLVRLIVRDEEDQATAAEAFIERGAWVPVIALVETAWVLESVYELDRKALALAIEMLLDHRCLVLQDAEMVTGALTLFCSSRGVRFSDCVIWESARRAGHGPLGTFDRAMGRIEGAQRL